MTNEEFKKQYEALWTETWHRGETTEAYKERIKTTMQLPEDAFNKAEAAKRYNKDAENADGFTKEQLKNSNEEEWRFLDADNYKKEMVAVSSLARVAIKQDEKYHIIKQDDPNNDGYLKLDPDEKYHLDHLVNVYKLISMGFFGKRSGDGYDVHHKINDGYNCRPSNLVLLTRKQHDAVHSAKKLSPEELDKFPNV